MTFNRHGPSPALPQPGAGKCCSWEGAVGWVGGFRGQSSAPGPRACYAGLGTALCAPSLCVVQLGATDIADSGQFLSKRGMCRQVRRTEPPSLSHPQTRPPFPPSGQELSHMAARCRILSSSRDCRLSRYVSRQPDCLG